MSTQTVNWILIIGIILFIIELTFFNGGLIISGVIFGVLAFAGWKNYEENWGKVLFWIGLIGLVITFLNTIAVRFLVVVCIILFLIDYSKNRKLSFFKPERSSDSIIIQDEPIVRINPLFKQILYGDQYTEQTAYEWSDINIQGLIGDKVIDLSNTVLPDDTAVISIRHGVGNIVIYVPYDVEFSIQHSAAFGRAYILHKEHLDLLNQNVHYETGAYGNAISRVKIVTSLISGNIEVKRI